MEAPVDGLLQLFDNLNLCKMDFFLPQQARIGNRSYLSKIDIQQMNMMYKCNGGWGGNPPPPPPGKKIKTFTNEASCP